MKPILELLIEDIKYDIEEIENTDETDYKKVYEMYINIYKRFESLSREAFDSDYKYELFESKKKLIRNSGFFVENGIKNGINTENKYFIVRRELEELSIYLSLSRQ